MFSGCRWNCKQGLNMWRHGKHKYMLFTGWEIPIGKNCARALTGVTTNTRPTAFKRVGPKQLCFGGRQSKKSCWNYFESLQNSKATRQEIENFTSLREGKSCLN